MPVPLPNPLYLLHQQAEAEFQPYADVQIVSTFGEPQAEYAAIRKACALMDLPQRGVLEIGGRDRLAFLNNLITNQTFDKQSKKGLEAGQGVYAFLLNNKGRIIADVNVLERGERTLLEMDGRMVEPVRALLEKYLFAEQVKISSAAGSMHEVAMHGPDARDVLGEAMGSAVSKLLPQMGSFAGRMLGREVVVWRDDVCGVPGYHLLIPVDAAGAIWSDLVTRFGTETSPGKRRLRPVGWAAFNATRIEAGRPLFGVDFDESVLPAETGQLARAVNFTKGCYVGQEIVARMHARGQLVRQLVGIRMEGDALPIAGAKLFDAQQNEIGGITSSTMSPVLSDVPICLGYVRRAFANPGASVLVPAEGAMRNGTVVELPFVRSEGA